MGLPKLSFAASVLAATLAFASIAGGQAPAAPAGGVSSLTSAVTIYSATWCGACRSLEAKLNQRSIPFQLIDVDRNRDAYDRARAASGMGNGIPLTSVSRDTTTWIQGDNADAVERAYKGE